MSLHYAAVPAQPWDALARAWLPRLPSAKRAAVMRLREAADRNASLVGIALLESALAVLGASFDSAALEFPRHGKPRLAAGPDFSISHAAGLVACAVALGGRVGLDLERAGAVRDTTARRVLAPVERARLARGELSATDAWVMKEAVVKLAGRGLGALASVRLLERRACLDDAEIWLAPVMLRASHIAWLATDAPAPEVALHELAASAIAPLPETA